MRTLALAVCVLLLGSNLAGLLFPQVERPPGGVEHRETLRAIDGRFGELGGGPAFLAAATRDYAAAVRYVTGAEWRRLASPSWRSNYLVYLLAQGERAADALLGDGVWTGRFRHYERRHYAAALARGFGICSQNALGLSDLLTVRYGIPTQIVRLDGHVVLQAGTPDGRYLLLDPSLGLAFGFDAAAAPARLDEIVRAYAALDPHWSSLAPSYAAAGNGATAGRHGARDAWPSMYLAETPLAWLKWAIPAALGLAALAWPGRRSRAAGNRTARTPDG